MKRILLHLILALLPTLAFSQQDVIFSQFMFKKAVINPGYVGTSGHPHFTFIHRQQWVGLEGSPITQAFSFETPLFAERVGVGISLINDNIGYFNSSLVNMQYAYRIDTEYGGLGLGLQGTLKRFYANWDASRTIHDGDPILGEDAEVTPIFNVGFGAYFEAKRWYLGVSVPYFLKKGLREQNQGLLSDISGGESPHYYLVGGLLFDLSRNVKLRPAWLVKFVKNAPLNSDLNLSLGLKDKLWFGVTYRWGTSFVPGGGGAIDFLVNYQISQRLRAGMAYDYALSELAQTNGGTYEIMLEYSIIRDGKGVRNPRFF
ncbi:MAG: type IX secretion system membrane protein PorP/SprF [Bacteroidota bacterium]